MKFILLFNKSRGSPFVSFPIIINTIFKFLNQAK